MQDDNEFREYLSSQDSIANNFLKILGLQMLYLPQAIFDEVNQTGGSNTNWIKNISLPSPMQVFGHRVEEDVVQLNFLNDP